MYSQWKEMIIGITYTKSSLFLEHISQKQVANKVLRGKIGTAMTNKKSRADPSSCMASKGSGRRRRDCSRKRVPSCVGHTRCVPQEKFDSRIFPAAIVPQGHNAQSGKGGRATGSQP